MAPNYVIKEMWAFNKIKHYLQETTSKTAILLCFLGCLLSVQQAQAEEFFSVSVNNTPILIGLPAAVNLQRGWLEDDMMFRVGADLPSFLLTIDASYFETIPETELSYYVGGGIDITMVVLVIFAVHGNIGTEYRQDNLGLFAEYQPGYFVSAMAPGASGFTNKVRAGLKFYF